MLRVTSTQSEQIMVSINSRCVRGELDRLEIQNFIIIGYSVSAYCGHILDLGHGIDYVLLT